MAKTECIDNTKKLFQKLEIARERGLKAAGEVLLHQAGLLTPVDTGALKTSLKVTLKPNQVILSADTDYANAVEYGTSNMDAQPFMRPALYNNKKRLLDAYKKFTMAVLKK